MQVLELGHAVCEETLPSVSDHVHERIKVLALLGERVSAKKSLLAYYHKAIFGASKSDIESVWIPRMACQRSGLDEVRHWLVLRFRQPRDVFCGNQIDDDDVGLYIYIRKSRNVNG